MIHWHFKKKKVQPQAHTSKIRQGRHPPRPPSEAGTGAGPGAAACGGLLPAPPCPDRAPYPVWAPVSRHYHETDDGSDKEMQLGTEFSAELKTSP